MNFIVNLLILLPARIASLAMTVGSTTMPSPASAHFSSVSPLSERSRPEGRTETQRRPTRKPQSTTLLPE